eukprot:3458847-Amphidinium_carterae.1
MELEQGSRVCRSWPQQNKFPRAKAIAPEMRLSKVELKSTELSWQRSQWCTNTTSKWSSKLTQAGTQTHTRTHNVTGTGKALTDEHGKT